MLRMDIFVSCRPSLIPGLIFMSVGQFIEHIVCQAMGAFFWDYSGIGILGIDGIRVLLGAIPFSKCSAPDSRMNRIRFTRNTQNTGRIRVLLGNFWREIPLDRPLAARAAVVVLRSPPP